LIKSIKRAIDKKGFAFIEVMTQCPVQFGSKTGAGSAVEMLKMFKEQSISIDHAGEMNSQDLQARIVVGEFVDIEKPELCEEVERLKKRMRKD